KDWLRFVILTSHDGAKSVGKVPSIELDEPVTGTCKLSRHDSVCPLPEVRRNGEGIDVPALPPGPFVAASVEFAMVQPANRNGEFVAGLAPDRPLLRKLDMVSVRGAPSAHETGLRGDKPQMIAIAFADRLPQGEGAIRSGLSLRRCAVMASQRRTF